MPIVYCCVDNCTTRRGSGLAFFRCPKDARSEIWRNQLGFTGSHRYATITPAECYEKIRICSLHFSDDSFTTPDRKRLNYNSIPTLSLCRATVGTTDETDIEESEMPVTSFSCGSNSEEQVKLNTSEHIPATPQTFKTSTFKDSNQTRAIKRTKFNAGEQKRQKLLKLAYNALSKKNTEDEYDIVGKRIGLQLKGIEEHQRIIAEKLISDVIFYAKIGKLTEYTSVHIPSFSQSEPINPCPQTCSQPNDFLLSSQPQTTVKEEISDITYSILEPMQEQHCESTSSSVKLEEY